MFSSPTPDTLSWAEIVIGFCLFCAVGFHNITSVFSGRFLFHDPERRFLTACFLILLIPAAMMGVWGGYETQDMLRDIIPLGFFFLPLFLYGKDVRSALLVGIVFTGVMFALRFWPSSGLTLARFGMHRGNDEMLYLTSSPAVLCAGLYLLFQATRVQRLALSWRIAAGILSAVCLLTIAATLQRGAIILSIGVTALVFFTRGVTRPHFLTGILGLALIFAVLFGPVFIDIMALIGRKTAEVGDNARLAEWYSVIGSLGDDPVSWLFGRGWGARILTAASGYAEVRYTHMLLSYMLLKAGLIGLLAVMVYIAWLVRCLWVLFGTAPLIASSIAPSFVLGILFYPSFKMLCFGAMLALASTAQSSKRQE